MQGLGFLALMRTGSWVPRITRKEVTGDKPSGDCVGQSLSHTLCHTLGIGISGGGGGGGGLGAANAFLRLCLSSAASPLAGSKALSFHSDDALQLSRLCQSFPSLLLFTFFSFQNNKTLMKHTTVV